MYYFQSGPFVIQSPAVGSFHQQLWLTAQIVTAKIEGETFARQFVSSIQVRGLNNLGSGGISMFDGAYHNSSQVLTCSQVSAVESCVTLASGKNCR